MPVVGPLIGAAAGIGGSLLSSSASNKASKRAVEAQQASDAAAIAEQRRQFDITQGNFAPFLKTGTEALGGQADLLGLNGGGVQQGAIDALQGSPYYQSLFNNGQNAILANASASGGLRGGNMQRSLADFGRDSLSLAIQQQLANLGGLSGQGMSSAGSLGSLGGASANNISSLLSNSGTVAAQGALAQGANNAQNINNIFGSLGGLLGNSGVQTALGKLF